MSGPTLRPAFRTLPLARVDEPDISMREEMDPTGLEELADSIQRIGLVQPVSVIVVGERFRIVAGHRRLLAHRLAQMPTIDALVYPEGAAGDEEAIKTAENHDREEVNPGAEACYYAELLEKKCGGDVDRLCELVRRKRAFVEGRLNLLRGDLHVLEALKRRAITLAVAYELNKVSDDGYRLMYLRSAVRGGATASVVRTWRVECDRFLAQQTPPPAGADEAVLPTGLQPVASIMRCDYCSSDADPHDMELIYRHRSCSAVLNRSRRAAAQIAEG